MSWTEDRVELLTKLWGEGRTAAEIAKELGGVTRNAVIGKAHRLKLSNRMSPIQQNNKKAAAKPVAEPKKAVAKKPAAATTAPKAKTAPKVEFTGKGVAMADLTERMCRWPIGDPQEDDFTFCGCKKMSGLPYCSEHAKVAYQAATRNRILKAEDFESKGDNAVKDEEISVAS